jgi:hypothetical protein
MAREVKKGWWDPEVFAQFRNLLESAPQALRSRAAAAD